MKNNKKKSLGKYLVEVVILCSVILIAHSALFSTNNVKRFSAEGIKARQESIYGKKKSDSLFEKLPTINLSQVKKSREVTLGKQGQDFIHEMKGYETNHVRYEGGIMNNYARFSLDFTDKEDKVVFGEDLPTGNQASLNVIGEGFVNLRHKNATATFWDKAGVHGEHDFSQKETYFTDKGDYMEFDNIEEVEITIYF